MTGIAIGKGVSADDLAALNQRITQIDNEKANASTVGGIATRLNAAENAMPLPASDAPPAVQVDSATGDDIRYARANHTHESRLQARRMLLAFNSSGEAVYTFPKAYPAGTIPIIAATAETPTAASYRNDVSVREGSTTNTQTTLILTRTPKTLTVTLLGAVLNIFTTTAQSAIVNVMSRAPS